jgi:hypothetical protein
VNTDLTSVLHLTDIRGRALLAFYGAGTTLVALLTLGQLVSPWRGILALLLLWGALFLLGWRGTTPFGQRQTVVVIALVGIVAGLSAWNLRDVASPGYSGWYLGATTFVLLMLCLRGRRAAAWGGFALLATISLLSTFGTGQELFAAVNDLLRQAGTLFIGTLFALVVRRARAVIALIQRREVDRAASEAATATATAERATQNARLEERARPALERLLSDEPLSGDERAGMALLEAELRDGIRAAGFDTAEIVDETRLARGRGVQVVLVDDRGATLANSDRELVESALLEELRSIDTGTVTARLSSFDSDEIATIVVAEGNSYRSIVVSRDGVDVTTLSQ